MPENRKLFYFLFFHIMKMSGGADNEAEGFSYIFNRAGTHFQVIDALIELKNSLIAQGRSDAVDDTLIKVMKARRKRLAVHYI